VIGAGALAFPSAFAALGLIPGIVTCLISACLTASGLYLLSRCATVVGTRPGDEGRKASFNEVARLTFGKGWATRLFDVRASNF
jgi:amino acid permease